MLPNFMKGIKNFEIFSGKIMVYPEKIRILFEIAESDKNISDIVLCVQN